MQGPLLTLISYRASKTQFVYFFTSGVIARLLSFDCRAATYIKQVWIIFILLWDGDNETKHKLKLRVNDKTVK